MSLYFYLTPTRKEINKSSLKLIYFLPITPLMLVGFKLSGEPERNIKDGEWQVSETSKENFVKTNKLAICAILRDLQKNDTAVMVTHARGQFISRILDVMPETNQFIFDFGSVEHENILALAANQITIIAEPTGAKIEFACHKLQEVHYLSLPAYRSPLPEQLYFIQRREYFRINIPQWPAYYCTGKFSDGSKFSYYTRGYFFGRNGIIRSERQ